MTNRGKNYTVAREEIKHAAISQDGPVECNPINNYRHDQFFLKKNIKYLL